MSSLNRKFFVAYALLVGLPLLGLLGVLKAGRHLRAPVSVDGVWKVEADAGALAALPCLTSASASASDVAVVISQSGRELALGLQGGAKITAHGVIEGNTVRAWAVPSVEYSKETGCAEGQRLALNATVDADASPRTIAGKLWLEGCASCPAVEFRATRQVLAPKKEAFH